MSGNELLRGLEIVHMMSDHAYNRTLQAIFPTQHASAAIFLAQSSITALQVLWRYPSWWTLHGRCCTGPDSMNVQLCVFLHYHTGPTFLSVRMHRRLVPTSEDHHKRTVFVSCNWPLSLRKIGASTSSENVPPAGWHGQGWILVLHIVRLLYHQTQRQVLGWCLVWHETLELVLIRAKTVSSGFTRGCGITENTLAKWVGALPFCIPPLQLRSLMAAKLSLLVTIVRHLATKTWDQRNRQIWNSSSRGSNLIYHLMGIMVAISFSVFWYYWWLRGELPQCRGSGLAAPTTGSAFIKPDQLDPGIKDQIKITLLPTIACKIGDSRVFPIWSLIHGSSWSGLIKAEPDGWKQFRCCQNEGEW